MNIEQLKTANETELADINHLFLQLSSSGRQATLAGLKKAVADKNLFIFAVIDDGRIVGIATLMTAMLISGLYGRVEDVVVDEEYRGQGLGRQLMDAVINQARKLKIHDIGLSSSPSRVAANKLYQKLGFEQKETNVYRMKL